VSAVASPPLQKSDSTKVLVISGIAAGVLLLLGIGIIVVVILARSGSSILGKPVPGVFNNFTNTVLAPAAPSPPDETMAPGQVGAPTPMMTLPEQAEQEARNGEWEKAYLDARQDLVLQPGESEMTALVQQAQAQLKSQFSNSAQNFEKSGQYAKAAGDAMMVVLLAPDDKAATSYASEMYFRAALAQGQNALAAHDLDEALAGAEGAVAHKPDDADAVNLLKQVRNEISTSHLYLGKNLVPAFTLPVAPAAITNIQPLADGTFLVTGSRTVLCDPVSQKATALPDTECFVPRAGPITILSRRAGGCIDLTGRLLWQPPPHANALALAVSPDGQLISIVIGKTFSVLNTSTGQPVVQTSSPVNLYGINTEQERAEAGGSFSSDGKMCAFRGADCSWNIVDVTSGQIVHTFPDERVTSCGAFGATRYFAYSTADHVSVVDLSNWQEVANIGLPGGIASIDRALDFTSDGKTLAVHARSGALRLFNATTGDQIGKTLPDAGHAFNPDGSVLLLDDGRDFTAYRTTDGAPVGKIPVNNAQCFAYAPDGRLYLGYPNGSVTLLGPPHWTDDTSIRSLSPVPLVDETHAFDAYSTNRANQAIAAIKKQYGLDVVIKAVNGLPSINGLQLLTNNNPGPFYLKLEELGHGSPGFYVLISRFPATTTWGEVPPSSGELLTSDQLKSLGSRLDNLSKSDDEGQALNQFLRELSDDLQQDHPEMTMPAAPEPGAISAAPTATPVPASAPAAPNPTAAVATPAPVVTPPPLVSSPAPATPAVMPSSAPNSPPVAPAPIDAAPAAASVATAPAPSAPPVNAGYPPPGGIKTNTVVIAPNGSFRLEEWNHPVPGMPTAHFEGWLVGNDGSAAVLPDIPLGTYGSANTAGPSQYAISPDGKYIVRYGKIAQGLGGAYLYQRQDGLNYQAIAPDLYSKVESFFESTAHLAVPYYIVEFSRWLPNGDPALTIRGSTDHKDGGVRGWECVYDPATGQFSIDTAVAAADQAAITYPPSGGTAGTSPAPGGPVAETPPAPPTEEEARDFDAQEILQRSVTIYSNGMAELNENFQDDYKNRTFEYEGIVGRHNNAERLIVFKGGGIFPNNWDLQVKGNPNRFPINSRVHIRFILRDIKKFPFTGWSFRGDDVEKI